MVIWAVIAVAVAIVLYWTVLAGRGPNVGGQRPSVPVLVLTGLCLTLTAWSVYLGRSSYSYTRTASPVAIAVAFDLSPSMLAIPDPTTSPGVKPRFERGKAVLTKILNILENRQQGIIVSIIGFTDKAGIIMGWDSNPAQILDMLDYGLSPDLFTSTGTNMDEASQALINDFKTLPENLQKSGRKIAIIVSDGEDTSRQSSVSYAVKELGSATFDMVALQAGLLDTDEGIPRYGDVGEFLGFRAMGGRPYTVPDVNTMKQLAASTRGRGLYVRAENPDAANRIMDFIGNERPVSGSELEKVGAVAGLFLLTALLCARLLL